MVMRYFRMPMLRMGISLFKPGSQHHSTRLSIST